MTDKAKPKPRTKVARVPPEVLLKTDEQLWQIATYVRSMSLPETIAANSGTTPSQHPAPVPREADRHGGWVLPEGTVDHGP